MAERKVLNKYYPSDFDPDKLRTLDKKNKRKICNVRMMLPMTMKCHSCGHYTYIGTKRNMKVEPVEEEDYLGIAIYRFYYTCSNCYSQITFKTDPKNNDYTAEIGASRSHEPFKDIMLAEEEYKNNKKLEMKDDAMKNLEYRTYDSKREMDILEATDQVKELNRREAHIDFDYLIKKIREDDEKIKKENMQEKKEIEKMYKNLKNQKENKLNKYDFVKLINNKMNINIINEKGKDKKKEKFENNFFLKKKVEREEKEIKKIDEGKSKKNYFLLDDDNSDKSEEKNIKDIFKKPLINFTKKLK